MYRGVASKRFTPGIAPFWSASQLATSVANSRPGTAVRIFCSTLSGSQGIGFQRNCET
jgi:hypothetical protein